MGCLTLRPGVFPRRYHRAHTVPVVGVTPGEGTMGIFDKMRNLSAVRRSVQPADEDRAVALIERGNVLEDSGEFRMALEKYEAAARLAPDFARVHLNRGNALLAMGDVRAGIDAYEDALTCNPDYARAYFNRGNARVQAGEPEAALIDYLRAIDLEPEFVDAHVAAGCVLQDLGRTPAAIASFERALVLRPDYAEVHTNLGNALRNDGQFESAVRSHQRALELDPALAQAHNNLGNSLKDLGLLEGAEASYRQALAINPRDTDAFSNLLFNHNYSERSSPSQLPAEARAYGELVGHGVRRFTDWKGTPDPSRCLRVGFVSGDLRDHPVGYFIESVAAALTAGCENRLQLIAYTTHRCHDEIAERIKAQFHSWQSVGGMSNESLAQHIHDDAIDLLIDLSGHTAHNRLPAFARRPSPVQATWLGYFATTGVPAIDHLIADPWTLPDRLTPMFTEKIWRLPETRLCFTAPYPSPPVGKLPAAEGIAFTFGCFNNLSKINEAVVALWARVLEAVPHSRLLLKSPQLQEASVRDRMLASFAAHGIGVERLSMEGLSPRFEYLSAYHQVDIALDPFPFTGGTTTMESLWMGVPVLTLAGESFLSRQGVGLMANAGLSEWIAESADRYVAFAVEYAGDLTRLAVLRGEMRQRLLASPVMDARRFAGHFESALRGMWQQWCASQPDQSSSPVS